MTTKNALDPTLLGFWARCVRDTQHMSQDALAAAASVDVRTIQRFESGKSVNITSRRCIARGLGYENIDIFDDPDFTASVLQVVDQIKTFNHDSQAKQHPDHVRVKAVKVMTGDALGDFAEASNAMTLHADDEISEDAKDIAAALFDYVRDLMDLDELPFSDKRTFNKDLENLLRDLESHGTDVYSAFRSVSMVGNNWPDKTPLPMTIGYLTAVPVQKKLDEIYVPRRARMG